MLIHAHDESPTPDAWRRFVEANSFGHLVASGAGRDVAMVVPTQFLVVEDTVWLHLARPNPIFEALAENPNVMLSIAGDWAYIPAAWKAIGDEDPRRGIPTTYYAAVQLIGTCVVVDDPTEVADILARQLDDLEPGSEAVHPSEHARRLRAIRGLKIEIAEVRAKFKYGGNADVEHRRAVATRLAERDGPGDRMALQHLNEQLADEPTT